MSSSDNPDIESTDESSPSTGISPDILALEANIEAILQSGTTPTLLSSIMADTSNYSTGTLSWEVNTIAPVENPASNVGRIYTKENRPDIGSKEEKELISGILTKQYEKYEMISTSVKDVESLKTNLSITQHIQWTKDCWERYDLLDPCNILFPSSANPAIPEMEGSTSNPILKQRDIFVHHRTLTVSAIATSCAYYQKYVTFKDSKGNKSTLDRELAWSYNHFREHLDANLYELVNSEFKLFPTTQQGGPLFLKLLLDKLVISNEKSLAALIFTSTTYDIKSKCTGENINEAIRHLKAITDSIIAMRDDHDHPLPEEYVNKMTRVLQTTSVQKFNTSFKKLEDDIDFNRLFKRTANSTALTAMGQGNFITNNTATQLTLDNNPQSITFLWEFAKERYSELVQCGDWDAATKTIQGATFNIQHQPFIRCWNFKEGCCDGRHNFTECPCDLDESRIERNRLAFREKMAKRNKSTPKKAWKFDPPKEGESDKRVIDGVPRTYNHANKWWDTDTDLPSGLHADKSVSKDPDTSTTDADTVATDLTSGTMPAADFAQLQLDLAHIQQSLGRFG